MLRPLVLAALQGGMEHQDCVLQSAERQSRNLEFWNLHVQMQGGSEHKVKSLLSCHIKIAKAA